MLVQCLGSSATCEQLDKFCHHANCDISEDAAGAVQKLSALGRCQIGMLTQSPKGQVASVTGIASESCLTLILGIRAGFRHSKCSQVCE